MTQAAQATIRVLCVDDHRLMREGIARIVGVQPDMTVVAQASDGEQAVEQFLRVRPDVTLMDLEMPTMRGVQAIHAIRRHEPNARIVVLTMYQWDEDIYRSLEAGAATYLLKDSLSDELVTVIRQVHEGNKPVPAAVEAQLESRRHQQPLTPREIQVVRLIAEGLRNKEIAVALGISEQTAKVHVKNILSKLRVNDRSAVIAVAARRGIYHL